MERYPYIYGAVGVRPHDVGALDEETIRRMHQICQMEKTVAVGEFGLYPSGNKVTDKPEILFPVSYTHLVYKRQPVCGADQCERTGEGDPLFY